MKPIEITVRDKVARLVDLNAFIVCGNSKYTVAFDFDEEWDEYDVKTAVFKWSGNKEEVVFTGNHCKVPIINNTVSVEIGVFAGDLQTTTGARVNAKKSVLCGTEKHHEPEPDVYNQLLELLKGMSGASEEEIAAAVETYLKENPIETALIVNVAASDKNLPDGADHTYEEIKAALDEQRDVRVYFRDDCYKTYSNGTEQIKFVHIDGYQIKWLTFSATYVVFSSKALPSQMTGATSSKKGTGGLVPEPIAGQEDHVLHGDGTWREIQIPEAEDDENGILIIGGESLDSLSIMSTTMPPDTNIRELYPRGKVTTLLILLGSEMDEILSITTADFFTIEDGMIQLLASMVTADAVTTVMLSIDLETAAVSATPFVEFKGGSGDVTREEFNSLSTAIANKVDKTGWTPEKFIGTDAEGNLVEKDAPTGGGTGTVTSVNGNAPDENGNVTVEVGQPTDEQIATAVDTWLDEHPEATTTVADGSITPNKLSFYHEHDKFDFDGVFATGMDFNTSEVIGEKTDADNLYAWAVPYWSNYVEIPSNHKDKLFIITNGQAGGVYNAFVYYDESYTKLDGAISGSIKGGGFYHNTDNFYLASISVPENARYLRLYGANSPYVLTDTFIVATKIGTRNNVKWDDAVISTLEAERGLGSTFDRNLYDVTDVYYAPWNTIKGLCDESKLAGFRSFFPIEVDNNEIYARWSVQTGVKWFGVEAFDDELASLGTAGLDSARNDFPWEIVYETSDGITKCLKFVLPDGAKYVRFATLQYSGYTLDEFSEIIISHSPIPLSSTPQTYAYYRKDLSANSVEDVYSANLRYYLMQEIGRITAHPSETPYCCWMHNQMFYDAESDVYVLFVLGANKHSHNVERTYLVTIDAKTLKSSNLTEMSTLVPNLTWAYPFYNSDGIYRAIACISSDNKYQYGDLSTFHVIESNDKGVTWTIAGNCTVSDTTVTEICHPYVLSSGRIIADVYADTAKNWIGYSDDNGLNWTIVNPPGEVCTEHAFVELQPGVIMMMSRLNKYPTTEAPCYIAYSNDNGETWSDLTASNIMLMHAGEAIAHTHDGIVDIFTTSRDYGAQNERDGTGYIYHYSATIEQAKNDEFKLRQIFYADSASPGDFIGPSIAIDKRDNMLIAYNDSNSDTSERCYVKFLYGNKQGVKPVCCDGVASDRLPYSGAKIEEMFAALRAELNQQ